MKKRLLDFIGILGFILMGTVLVALFTTYFLVGIIGFPIWLILRRLTRYNYFEQIKIEYYD
jgi:type IV secretory pathway VirB3-like protein